MDLLFKRYASPFVLLDVFLQSGRFSDFVSELIEIQNEELQWEFYIHKVEGKSFDEFKKSLRPPSEELSEEQLETMLDTSKSILNNFIPVE